jgi:hypothetical protein
MWLLSWMVGRGSLGKVEDGVVWFSVYIVHHDPGSKQVSFKLLVLFLCILMVNWMFWWIQAIGELFAYNKIKYLG